MPYRHVWGAHRDEARCGRHRSLRRALAAVLGTALLAAGAAHAAESSGAGQLCGQAGGIAAELADISGLKLHHPVPCDFITREKVTEFLNQRVKQATTPEELRDEELTLKKFGFVPQDFNLEQTTIDLLTEQAAAFYDYDKKKLFVTDTTAPDTQSPVLAHELSHAIADQNFNLAKFIRQGRKSDDGATARMAVMEGQATWLMSEYLARRIGESLKTSPMLARMMSGLSDSSGQFPVYDHAPLYLRQTLIFPYTKGMLFQQAVIEKDGNAAFAEVFQRPPVSTQQILHPEKYFDRTQPVDVPLPDPKLPRGFKAVVGGTLGELDHDVLLEQYGGKETAAAIGPHWRGASFELRENKKAARVVLLYAVQWDTPEMARRYFDFYRRVLAQKWKKMSVTSEDTNAVSGAGDDGNFELHLDGAIVTSVEGLPPAIN